MQEDHNEEGVGEGWISGYGWHTDPSSGKSYWGPPPSPERRGRSMHWSMIIIMVLFGIVCLTLIIRMFGGFSNNDPGPESTGNQQASVILPLGPAGAAPGSLEL